MGAALFDDLVGEAEQRERRGKTEYPCGFVADDQIDFCRLFDWYRRPSRLIIVSA
jgi:hypothetical protein